MWRNRKRQRRRPAEVVLSINNQHWRLRLVNVRRLASDWFVEIAAMGPRAHTIFVRSKTPPLERGTGGKLISLMRDWLGRDDPRLCAFLDIAGGLPEQAS